MPQFLIQELRKAILRCLGREGYSRAARIPGLNASQRLPLEYPCRTHAFLEQVPFYKEGIVELASLLARISIGQQIRVELTTPAKACVLTEMTRYARLEYYDIYR